jgi:heme-degrading monooxygenase HmoA
VIARTWTAQATPSKAPAYVNHLTNAVLPGVRKLAGYAGAMLFQRLTGDSVEITVITYWHSLDALRAFAGADVEKAVVAADALPLLIRFDQCVRHYEVVVTEGIDADGQGSDS